jgi:hypothetical protein
MLPARPARPTGALDQAVDAGVVAFSARSLVRDAVDALAGPALGGMRLANRRAVDGTAGLAVLEAEPLRAHRARQRALAPDGLAGAADG